MQYMVTTKVASMTKWRLFESYDEAVIYHYRQVDNIYFDNELHEIEIDTTRTYDGRIVGTRLIEWVEGNKLVLKEIGSVRIIEWEEESC